MEGNSSEFLLDIKENFLQNRLSEDVNPRLKSRYAFKDIPCEKIISLIEKFNLKFDPEKYDKDSLLKYINKRKKDQLQKWELIIDSGDINKIKDSINIGGFNLIPVERETPVKENKGLEHIVTKGGLNNSAIASPNMYSITFSKSELDEQRKNAEENEITLGKSILENNKIPKLLITILKLDLKKYMAEKDPSGTKEYLLSLPELYTLNLVLPPSSAPEKPREVWVNIDIDNPLERAGELDFVEDGDD